MELRNFVRIITLVPLTIFLLYCSYLSITTPITPTYLDCGKVVSKSNDEVTIKHGVKTELYLIVEFNKSGLRAVECSPTTYFSKKVNDEVCFNLNEQVSFWYGLTRLIGLGSILILVVVLLTFFIGYLLPDNWLF